VDSFKAEGEETFSEVTRLDQVASGYPVARMEWAAVDKLRARSQFVVAADGYHSLLRERLGLSYEQHGPVETFSVYEFDAGRDPGDEMRLVFDGESYNAFWPMVGGRCRWSFQIGRPSEHESTRERLNDLIKARASWFPPVSGEIHWASTVQFDRRLASAMGRDRVWLAGDSAHLSSPLGVQSMNTGLVDAHELSAALVAILRENAGPERLERYAEERLRELGPLFGDRPGMSVASGAPDWARGVADRMLRAVPATAGDLSRLLAQTGLEFDSPAESRE
jgi:2-polyprenyl-6-methoxyphenol hydroxylase-like FAD-dependent oxidoreductase